MTKTMGIILTGGKNDRLKELTAIRSSSAVPIGGKYRAIDFTLSNMVNSGITNVGVLVQFSFRSLMDHLGSGKEWDLDRRYDGLYVFPPTFSNDDSGWYRGTADAMYHNIEFLKHSNEEYVLIAQGNCIYKMVFDDMLDYHRQIGADITVAYREMSDFSPEELTFLGMMEMDDNGRVLDFEEKAQHPKTKNGSIGVYILKRELLISLLEECAAHGHYEFVLDVLVKKINSLKIYGYKFNGYWRNLCTVNMYYKLNMDLLNSVISQHLLSDNGKIYTKVKDEAPAKYNEEAEVKNSIIADGCIVEGTVINSVLFRGVIVKKGAVIKDSIVMQDTIIEEDVELVNTILDKDVVVTKKKCLRGETNWPVIIAKNSVV